MNKNYFGFFLTLAVGLTLLLGVTNTMAQFSKRSIDSSRDELNKQTVVTDKYIYNRGETVVIEGSGYNKFEPITIRIEAYNNVLGSNETMRQWDVYSDYNGQFTTQINMDSLNSLSGTYIVKAIGSNERFVAETTIIAAPEAIGVDIEQCANGPASTPIPCNVSGGNDGYTRGNLVRSKSHYVEGDSVPIRVIATGLTVGQSYTVTIGYDYTKGGKYADDYLTSYNRTESVNNNPCVNVTGCTLASVQTFPIPIDPEVTAGFDQTLGTSDDITQISGVFSIFGGTITNVSGYTRTGTQASDSSKLITITFTANQENVVIAYGSHIATRLDWGIGNSAIAISGSPYHNFVSAFPGANSGNRDLQFSASAIVYPAIVRIIKDAIPNAETDFTFTISGPTGITPSSSFILDDDAGAPGADNTYSNTQLISGVTSFGTGNEITVTEAMVPGWTLQSITCVEQDGGLGTTANSTTSVGLRNAVIRTQEAEVVTCTFVNAIVLAAGASIEGQITDSLGRGASNVSVRVSDLATGETRFVLTNPFGYYRIGDLEAGGNYLVQVSSKRYTFTPDSTIITLNDDIAGVNFTANP